MLLYEGLDEGADVLAPKQGREVFDTAEVGNLLQEVSLRHLIVLAVVVGALDEAQDDEGEGVAGGARAVDFVQERGLVAVGKHIALETHTISDL